MSITITDEQLAERDRWEGLLMQGKCSLHEALYMCLASGAPASRYLRDRIEEAFQAYQYGGPEAAVPTGRAVTFSPDDQSAAEMARLNRRPTLSVVEAPDKPKGPRGAKPQDLFGDYLKTLQRQLEATQELTSLETVLRDVQLGRLGSVSTKQLDALKNIAGEIDASKQFAAIEKEFAQAEKDSLARKKELAAAGQAVYDATRTPLEQLNIEQTKLNELLRLGAINADTFARATFALDETLGRVKEVGKELDTFAKTAAKNIQGAIGDGLVDILDGNFKDIGKSFTTLINRMVAEAAAAQIARSLFGGLVEGGKGSGLIGTALSAIGSAFGFGAAKASGGDVMANRSYLVGEQGPEMFVPRTMGAIVPNAALAGGGKSVQVTNNFTVQGTVDRRTQTQIATAAGRALQTAMARNG